MKTVWSPLKAKHAKASRRSEGTPTTLTIVVWKSDRWKAWSGTRSESNSPRRGSSMTAKTRHATAAVSNAPRQPVRPVSQGPRIPAIKSPAGTAVCFTENTSGACRGGE